MRRVILFAVVFQLATISCYGQQFTYKADSPFGIKLVTDKLNKTAQRIMFFDVDGDGDLDLFLTGLDHIDNVPTPTWDNIHYFIDVQENTGNKTHPEFANREAAFNGNFDFPSGYFFPAVGDVTGDGAIDLIVNGNVDFAGNRKPIYYQNQNHHGSFDFDLIPFSDMGLDDMLPESFFIPELTDLDSDGDLDIIMSGFNPSFGEEDGENAATFFYAQNQGSSSSPDFVGWFTNPYGLTPNPLVEITASGDVDNDGDMDVIGALATIPSDSMNFLYFHENVPDINNKPSITGSVESPFGLPVTHGVNQLLFPVLVDLDGDGDQDLFVFEGTSNTSVLKYFENDLCTANSTDVNVTICMGNTYIVGNESFDEPGDYIVTLEASGGCDSTVFLFLSVLPIPVTSMEETICEGESVFVGDSTFNAPGVYEVNIQTPDGCDSTVILNLTVLSVDNTVFSFENTLTANIQDASYQWFNCDTGNDITGETNQSFTATVSGNYAVRITDGLTGCSAISVCTSIIINSIEDDKLSRGLTIYPNPSHGKFYILNKNSSPVTSIKIINSSGQIVENPDETNYQGFDISDLDKGVYIVVIQIKESTIMKKLILI